MHKHDTVIIPAHQAYYPPSYSQPNSKIENTVPIMLNDDHASHYQYPASSNNTAPNSKPTRIFSPPIHNQARMPVSSDNTSLHRSQNSRSDHITRDIYKDRGRNRDVDVNRERDITTSHARAAIDGTQHSGIRAPSPRIRDVHTPLDDETESRTKSSRVGGEIRGVRDREREKKRKLGTKRMSVINDHQDQDEDQWPGDF